VSAWQHPRRDGDLALWQQSATDLAARIRCRELLAVEVMDAHLARIEQVNRC
jgi:Asp-tRNA(Asn)/Glu-tRNA(Gln) amidotransferase A subunit family amidase